MHLTTIVVNISDMPSGAHTPAGRAYGGLTTEERVAARREKLLDAAVELYGTQGFAATGVKAICREAGLTDRYFYESFSDATALFTATFDRVTSRLFAFVAEQTGAAGSRPEAQVRAAIGAFVGSLADDPRTARIVFLETASVGPQAERHMRATLRRFADLAAATSRPHLPPGTSASRLRLAAIALVGAIERVMIEWLDGEIDATLDEVIDDLVRLFLAVGVSAGVRQDL